jgi:negative regulator of replication initiation
MPIIEVDDEVYDHIARYARLWGQSMGEAVATLIRLLVQPDHTVAGPCGPTCDGTGHSDAADEVRR